MAERVIENIMKRVAYGGCVDEFMQDEIAIHQTLAEGRGSASAGEGEGMSKGACTPELRGRLLLV